MTLFVLWLQLGVSAGIILVASTFLAKSADIIAFKTGLGRSLIGVVLLATATSLPELGTGISSVALVDEPDLAAGDAFGSNLFNLVIIGLLDLFWRGGPILRSVGPTSLLLGGLGIAVISLAGIAVVIHTSTTALSGWYISPISVVLFAVFLVAMYMIFRSSQAQEREQAHDGSRVEEHQYAAASLSRASLMYLVTAMVVVGFAVWLARIGDGIAVEMGWEASYVGTQFLAFSTSLPELAASFAAIRLNAPDLAVSNLLGSNLFNMGFVLLLDDVAYSRGVVWAAFSEIHALTALIGVLMTSVVVIALVGRPRGRTGRFGTPESALLIGMYVAASVLVFFLG